LDVSGVGKSPVFEIGNSVFADPFKTMMLGFYLWRCGVAVNADYNGQNYQHAACHLNDGGTRYIGGTATSTNDRDGKGGWHDAGDYNKYTVNSGVAVALMLKAWEHYGEALNNIDLTAVNKEGAIPEFLAEVKWNLDWIAKMQYGQQGQVSHKLSSVNFCADTILPDADNSVRYFAAGGSESAGAFAGMMAQAARVYAPYDYAFANACLTKARLSYDWLKSNPNFTVANQTAFSTGTYTTGDGKTAAPYKVNYDTDKRLWAAIELWEATGEDKFLNDFEGAAKASDLIAEIDWGEWGGVSTVACVTYLFSERAGRNQSLVNSFKAKLVTVADSLVANTQTHGYGRVFGAGRYYWGGHGTLTASSYILNMAYAATGEKKYREAGHEIIGYIFGRNYYGRSFVTGIGHNPPVKPHDRRSQATKKPWPGYIIGGPHANKGGGGPFSITPPELTNCASDAVCWRDDERDYWTNEIAINWNASMVYALAAYLPGSDPSKTGILQSRKAAPAPQASKIKTTRIVVKNNGVASTVIPMGAKAYGLDGRLIAHRRAGDAKSLKIGKNGVFIMRVDN
jgi:endoglucanase